MSSNRQSHQEQRPHAKAVVRRIKPAQKAKRLKISQLIVAALIICVLGGIGYLVAFANGVVTLQVPSHSAASVETVVEAQAAEPGSVTLRAGQDDVHTIATSDRPGSNTQPNTATFLAVGDNLMNQNLLDIAHTGDSYNFQPFYDHMRNKIASYNIAFVNQETTLGGTDHFGYSGYPSYNTPDTMADALSYAGFNLVNTNSNHTYDHWVADIEHMHAVFATHPNLMTLGSYSSQEDADKNHIIEVNGLKLAFLSYSYGQNGYTQADLPNTYYAVPMDEDKLKADIAHAREVADAVVVYMHAGTEYSAEPNDQQIHFAQVAADNGAALVIGSHAHVIQRVATLTPAETSPRQENVPCVYGLGDFLAGYENYPETIMSGAFSCTFRKGEDGVTRVENLAWEPVIEHMQDNHDSAYFLSDYSSELAKQNVLLAKLDDPYGWISQHTREVIGDSIPLVGVS